jgi:hypothetical protein
MQKLRVDLRYRGVEVRFLCGPLRSYFGRIKHLVAILIDCKPMHLGQSFNRPLDRVQIQSTAQYKRLLIPISGSSSSVGRAQEAMSPRSSTFEAKSAYCDTAHSCGASGDEPRQPRSNSDMYRSRPPSGRRHSRVSQSDSLRESSTSATEPTVLPTVCNGNSKPVASQAMPK